ncbi:hypothetical protein CKM354_001205700 [Cercospora kikuchii]|uniref:Uncharacterized protein n=1 Tax=Cercospora kikuchii TaxID=84275 RepID=A0A9P3CU70_9PEZI|nr:uncharacterized protein CKM354_001205700 [Cercospora kikuchii]GIZ49016.1 hypothetical protein CKM354_001205700 [Cercospora kikuchii]
MTYLQNRFDYQACTINELRSFIKDRTKEDPPAWTKEELIAKLESLDGVATFPLMSLPKDLRLCIYDELAFHPQILATSRDVHEEAKPIISSKSTVTTLHIEGRPAPPMRQHPHYPVYEPALRVNDGQWLHLPQKKRDVSLVEDLMCQLVSWPEEIANARHLDVTIDCAGLGTIPLRLPVYQLATSLTGSSSEIRLRVQNLPWVQSAWDLVYDVFWPLLLMGPRIQLIVEGFPEETVDGFQRGLLETQTPPTTALYRYRCFQERIKQVALLAKEAGIGWSCMDLYTALKRARRLADHYYHLNRKDDAEWYRSLEDLEREVSVLGPYGRIRKEALAILEARNVEQGP